MKRKVVKLGPATLVISLPSKWTKKFEIEQGDELELEEKNSSLIIEAQNQKKYSKEITINITEDNKHDLKLILTHIYRLGYDKIIITGNDIDDIKKITNNLLMGFEVTSRNNKQYIIENISEPEDQKYETILRRIFLIIKETQELLSRSLKENKFNQEENEELRIQLDKYISFCRRILYNKKQEQESLKWELLSFLMYIHHAYYYLYKHIAENKLKKDNNLNKIMINLSEYFDLLYQGYFKKDIKLIHKVQKLKDKYQYGICLKLISGNKNQVIYSYIREIFRLIQIGTSPVLALLLNQQYLSQ